MPVHTEEGLHVRACSVQLYARMSRCMRPSVVQQAPCNKSMAGLRGQN
jgi:hypothetical protein